MLEFIVLGQVPGTQIQLSFQATLLLCVAVLLAVKMLWPFRHRVTKAMEKPASKLEAIIIRPSTRRRA
jgi:hypothetical protein